MFFGAALREKCAAGEFAVASDDQSRIGVDHVILSALRRIGGVSFAQVILLRNSSVFRKSSFRTPTAVLEAVDDGKIESGAIDAGLTSTNDFCHSARADGGEGTNRTYLDS